MVFLSLSLCGLILAAFLLSAAAGKQRFSSFETFWLSVF